MTGFIITGKVYRDEEGTRPLPTPIGPFQTREHADIFMEMQKPLWGTWGIGPLASADEASMDAGRES